MFFLLETQIAAARAPAKTTSTALTTRRVFQFAVAFLILNHKDQNVWREYSAVL